MVFYRVAVVALMAAGLAGCNTTRAPGEAFLTDEQIERKDDAQCRSYGIARGHPNYAACRFEVQKIRISAANAEAARVQSSLAMAQFGLAMMQPPPQVSMAPVTCDTWHRGAFSTTNCR